MYGEDIRLSAREYENIQNIAVCVTDDAVFKSIDCTVIQSPFIREAINQSTRIVDIGNQMDGIHFSTCATDNRITLDLYGRIRQYIDIDHRTVRYCALAARSRQGDIDTIHVVHTIIVNRERMINEDGI